MPIYSWPACKWEPINRTWKIRTIAQTSTSPFTGSVKAATSGSLWFAEATFMMAKHYDAVEFQAFLEGLEGPVNPVLMYDWRRPYLKTFDVQEGQPWSDGTFFGDGTGWLEGSQSIFVGAAALPGAKSITLTGLPPSKSYLSKGDLLGIGGNLIQIMSDTLADSAGVAMVSFLPALRSGVFAGTPVVSERPKVMMRMMPDSEIGIGRDVTLGTPITLSFVEAIDLP